MPRVPWSSFCSNVLFGTKVDGTICIIQCTVGNDQKMTNVGKSNGSEGEDMTQNRWNWYPP